ncbi:MAG: ATP-binding protein [Bacteroidota bacterium]
MGTKGQKRRRPKTVDISESHIVISELDENSASETASIPQKKNLCILIDGDPLKTPKGSIVAEPDEHLLREIVAELEYEDKLDVRRISLYNLYCTQKDFLEDDAFSPSDEEIDEWIRADPVLKTCAGPEVIDQLRFLGPITQYLEQNKLSHPHFSQGSEPDESYFEFVEGGRENFDGIRRLIRNEVKSFGNEQLAVLVTVLTVYYSALLGILLAKGTITASQFAVAYLTSHCINSKVWEKTDRKEERTFLEEVKREAQCMLNYLDVFSSTSYELRNLLTQGEGMKLEFKATMRWNLRANIEDRKMEHAVLKSVAAFLNTDGGTLLVGVSDQGEVLGIELDKFPDSDKYLLHFANLLKRSIGKKHLNNIHYQLVGNSGCQVLRVDCTKSTIPVFLLKGKTEEFYIRTGPSSIPLSTSESVQYIQEHFRQGTGG